jgi:hypothetical protein
MLPRFQSMILLVSLALLVGLLGACTSPTPTPPSTQSSGIRVAPIPPIPVGAEVDLSVEAAGSNLQYKWTTTNGTILSPATTSAVRYKAPDSPGSATVTVEVTGNGGSVTKNISLQIVQPVTATPTPTSTPTPMPTLTPSPTISPDCTPGNLLNSGNPVPIFVPNQSRLTITIVGDTPASKKLLVNFKNSSNGSGVALQFSPVLSIKACKQLEIRATSSKPFTFAVEYKADQGNGPTAIQTSSKQSFPKASLIHTAVIPLTTGEDAEVSEIVINFVAVGEAADVSIESMELK